MSAHPPNIPDYRLIRCIGRGGYGEVWLARGVTGLHRAVKIVHRAGFSEERPYEREFSGIKKFQAVSHSQENLVNILHVGRNDEAGYFFYVMELADPAGAAGPWRIPGSDLETGAYESGTLKQHLRRRGRLPVAECLTIAKGLGRAIAHLHRHGLIHRDIKPSNVIFVNGVPKLADIGLVAGLDESRSFVGTEGFVPPEGPGTVGADLYALGRLLYEMSNGRDRLDYPRLPENFEQLPDRSALLEFNEVVLKAGDPERARRYGSADELVRDLLLLEAGKSVRRLRVLETRFAMALRTAAAAIVIMLVALAAWLWATFQAREARQSHAASERHRLAAEAALRDVLLNQVRANRQSGLSGQRLESLRLLRENPAMTNNLAFRSEAIACLALPDARPLRTIPLPRGVRWTADHALTRYATNDRSGSIWVRSVVDDRLLQLLPGPGPGIYRFGFSADDLKIGASYQDRRFIAWELAKYPVTSGDPPADWASLDEGRRPPRVSLPANATLGTGVPDSDEFAVLDSGGRLHFIGIGDGTIRRVFALDPTPSGGLRFSLDGIKFAVGMSNACGIYRADDGQNLFVLRHPGPVAAFAWHPDGRRLATACHDFKIRIWDTATGQQLGAFEDHEAEAIGVEFDATGTLLASTSWDDTTRLWAPESARALVRLRGSGNNLRIAPDGTRLAYSTWEHERIVITELLPGRERVALERFRGIYGLNFSPDGRWIVAGSTEGLHLWQWPHFHPAASLPVRDCPAAAFTPDGQLLVSAGRGVAAAWPFRADPAPDVLRIGPAHEFGEVHGQAQARVHLSPDARQAALVTEKSTQLFQRDGDEWRPVRRLDGKVHGVEFSPDGRWLVIGRKSDHLDVEDAQGRVVTNLVSAHAVATAFSPDNRWLVVTGPDRYRAFRTGSWEPGPSLAHTNDHRRREFFTFAREAGLAAFRTSERELSLVDVDTWETLARIPIPLHATAAALSPDGARLGVATEKLGVTVWDLARIRHGLAGMGLDWSSRFPAAHSDPVPGAFLKVTVTVDQPRSTNANAALAARLPRRSDDVPAALLDLSAYYNGSLDEGWIPSFQLGATADHVLPIPSGIGRWAGTEFDVRGVIQLASSTFSARGGRFPAQVSGIPVGRRVQRLHFLHGTDWRVKDGTTIGGYIVRYATGEEEVIRMNYGRDVLDWWVVPPTDGSGATNGPVVAWVGSNPASRRQNCSVRVYKMTWENPRWDVPVQSIDFASTKTACGPFLLAITTD